MTQSTGLSLVTFALPLTGAAMVPWRYMAATEHSAEFLDAAGVVVGLAGYGTGFTISPSSDTPENTGVLTLVAIPPALATQLRLMRRTTRRQNYAATPGAEGVEAQLDRLTLILQEQQDDLDGTLRIPGAETAYVVPGADGVVPIWQDGSLVPGPTADEIAAAQSYAERAELAAGALTSLTDRIAYPFEITLLAGRGPYALPYDPGSATYLDVVINRLSYVAPDDFTVVAMPSAPSGQGILFAADHYAGDAVMVKYGLPVGHDPSLNTALSYATLADFAAAVTSGLLMPNGQTVTAGGVRLVAEVGAALTGLPLGWRPADYVYTFAEMELWPTLFRPGAQHITVNDDGYYVAYERDTTGASTDLTTAQGEAFIKRGIGPTDLATLAADVANSIRQNATAGIGVYGGTADAITLAVGSGYSTIPVRYQVRFRATATNTGAATVSVDGLPAVALRTVGGVALPAGYLRTDVDTTITFDGTYWVVAAAVPETAMTRAQLVAYVTGRTFPIGTVLFADDLAYRYTGTGTEISDMPGWVPHGGASLAHWVPSFAVDISAKIVEAIAWLNAGGIRTLELPSGVNIRYSGPWPAILGANKTIIGNRANLINTNSGATFVFGNSSETAARCRVTGIVHNLTGIIPANDFMVDFFNATNCVADDLHGAAACFVRYGSASFTGAGCSFRAGSRMVFDAGANADSNVLILRGQNLSLELNGTAVVTSNTNPTGAMIRIAPPAGEQVDTVNFYSVGMQAWNASAALSPTTGKPYGLIIDNSAGFGTNIFCHGVCYLDHTSIHGVYVTDGAGSTTPLLENYKFNNMRVTPDAGTTFRFEKLSAATYLWAKFSVQHSTMLTRDAAVAAEISGAGYTGCILSNNIIHDVDHALPKLSAIKVSSDGWTITGNSIGCQTNAISCGFTAGIEVASAAIIRLLVANNQISPGIANSIVLPTFATPDIDAPRRNIARSGHVVPRTIRHIQHPLADVSVAANVMTIRDSGLITLGMAAPQTVQRIVSGMAQYSQITFANNGTNAVTFTNAIGRIRTGSGAAVVLNQHQTLTLVLIGFSGTEEIWLQIGGKV